MHRGTPYLETAGKNLHNEENFVESTPFLSCRSAYSKMAIVEYLAMFMQSIEFLLSREWCNLGTGAYSLIITPAPKNYMLYGVSEEGRHDISASKCIYLNCIFLCTFSEQGTLFGWHRAPRTLVEPANRHTNRCNCVVSSLR